LDKNGGVGGGAKLPDLPSQHEMDSYMLGLQRYMNEVVGKRERGLSQEIGGRGGGGGDTRRKHETMGWGNYNEYI
jgi:hypothetical protein